MKDRNIPREFRAWSLLEPQGRASLESQVERALAKRSIAGGMVYFLVTIVVALSTGYFSEHPAILGFTGIATLGAGVIRIATSRRLLAETQQISESVRRSF